MNKRFMTIKRVLLLILAIGEANSLSSPENCSLYTDARLNTNLTVTVEHAQNNHTAVWVHLPNEFFTPGNNINCNNIYLNGSTPNSCDIEQGGNTCSQSRCMIKLYTDVLYGGTDTIDFTRMNFHSGTSGTTPRVTAVYSEYNEIARYKLCDITLPIISNDIASIQFHYIYLYIYI